MQFNTNNFISQSIRSKLTHFDELAIQLYNHQVQHNEVLARYLSMINENKLVSSMAAMKFLPINFFKTQAVTTGNFTPEIIFTSSATTGNIPSKHLVANHWIYEKSYHTAFEQFYGPATDYTFLCLLPNYLERQGSSLVDMAQGLINASQNPDSGFYLYDFEKLAQTLTRLNKEGKKVFLLGVTFALIDFAAQFPMNLSDDVIITETGGMKGRKEEQTRAEIHTFLKQQFGVTQIHSEYGMTELLSQAYSKGNGIFVCAPWMQVIITDPNDPFCIMPIGKAGIINVIDLANVSSCAFIQTQDLGRLLPDGQFEVLGRMDYSETRGCNLMYV